MKKERSKYTIYIDTTKRYEKLVTLYKGDEEIATSKGNIDIAGEIQKILNKTSLNVQDVEIVKANPGPGSFTGIKIGLTIANVLNRFFTKAGSNNIIEPEYGGPPNIT